VIPSRHTYQTPFSLLAGVLLAAIWLAVTAYAASAHGPPAMSADGGTDAAARVISDVAVAVVRFLIGAGVAVFVVGVARGAFDGVLASVFGSPGAASLGLMRMAGMVAAFLLLMLSFGASRAFVEMLVNQFINKGALAAPVPGRVDVYVPAGAQGLQDFAGVIGEVLRIVLFLMGAWFLVNMLLALVSGQIGFATGSPGALARLVERIVTSLVLLVIGAFTPSLTRDLGLAIDTVGAVSNAGQAIHLYGVVFAMVIDILLAVFVAVVVVVVVGSGFVAQAGVALGLPGGLGTGIARVVTAFVLALLGFGAISVANHVLISLLG